MGLGGMTVGELLERISSRELSEWMAFFRLEPWGAVEEEYRAGLTASVVAETARDEKRRRKPFSPVDFMRFGYEARLEEEGAESSTEQLAEKVKAIFGRLQER